MWVTTLQRTSNKFGVCFGFNFLLPELLLLLLQFNGQPRSYLKLGVSLSTTQCVKVSQMCTSLNAPLCGSGPL